jgi:hypothetical protein
LSISDRLKLLHQHKYTGQSVYDLSPKWKKKKKITHTAKAADSSNTPVHSLCMTRKRPWIIIRLCHFSNERWQTDERITRLYTA